MASYELTIEFDDALVPNNQIHTKTPKTELAWSYKLPFRKISET
jgi:hypothetical protein